MSRLTFCWSVGINLRVQTMEYHFRSALMFETLIHAETLIHDLRLHSVSAPFVPQILDVLSQVLW